jgi:hypothetical protein
LNKSSQFLNFSEFEELGVPVQLDLMNRNGPGGLALTVARYESCRSGIQQIRAGFGAMEEEFWNQNYLPIFRESEKLVFNS